LATKLPVSGVGTYIGKKLWKIHQDDEYTHVDNYKEGKCWFCFKRNVVSAMVLDICKECVDKRGSMEATLAAAGYKPYGLCSKCGKYKFDIHVLNLRVCISCFSRVRRIFKKYNKEGGVFGSDPFWKSLRKKHGKDFQILMSDGVSKRFRR